MLYCDSRPMIEVTFYDSKMFIKIAKSQQVNQQHVLTSPPPSVAVRRENNPQCHSWYWISRCTKRQTSNPRRYRRCLSCELTQEQELLTQAKRLKLHLSTFLFKLIKCQQKRSQGLPCS